MTRYVTTCLTNQRPRSETVLVLINEPLVCLSCFFFCVIPNKQSLIILTLAPKDLTNLSISDCLISKDFPVKDSAYFCYCA